MSEANFDSPDSTGSLQSPNGIMDLPLTTEAYQKRQQEIRRLSTFLPAAEVVDALPVQHTNTDDTAEYYDNLPSDSESDASDQNLKEDPNKFLPGIESVKCFICHFMYKTGPEGGEHYEHPLTLHCKHTFGAKCLAKWVNENPSNDIQCPTCRGQTYKKQDHTRSMDMVIENFVFSLDSEDSAARTHAVTILLVTKLSDLKQDPKSSQQLRLPESMLENCILRCIWTYLSKSIETAHSEDRYTTAYEEALRAVELLLESRIYLDKSQTTRNLQDLITIVLNQTPKLTISKMERLSLALRLLDDRGVGPKIDFNITADELGSDEFFIAAQIVPRLLYCFWKARDTAFCEYHYEVAVEALYEADVARGNVDNVWHDNVCVGRTFTLDHMRILLESWGIGDVQEGASKSCGEHDEWLFLKVIENHWSDKVDERVGQPLLRTLKTNSQGDLLLEANQE